MKVVNVQVIGKVQGVSFRFSTMEKAKSLQLKGWVKNQMDGSVKILAQGADNSIASLIEWCHNGPTAASVDKVMVEELNQSTLQHLESFEIRR